MYIYILYSCVFIILCTYSVCIADICIKMSGNKLRPIAKKVE